MVWNLLIAFIIFVYMDNVLYATQMLKKVCIGCYKISRNNPTIINDSESKALQLPVI